MTDEQNETSVTIKLKERPTRKFIKELIVVTMGLQQYGPKQPYYPVRHNFHLEKCLDYKLKFEKKTNDLGCITIELLADLFAVVPLGVISLKSIQEPLMSYFLFNNSEASDMIMEFLEKYNWKEVIK